jgi:signal transduction histidine kinase/ActR/RegA family two-component response regulator
MSTQSSSPYVQAEGGSIRALLQENDWASLSLGPPESWPDTLRFTVDLISRSRFPMFLAWGPELRLLYNEACVEFIGEGHPSVLGQPFQQALPAIWAQAQPIIANTLEGKASLFEDLPFHLDRDGCGERRYFTFSYSPVVVDGAVAGVFCVLAETTDRVLAERRHAFHLELGNALHRLEDPVQIMEVASSLTGRYLGIDRVGYGEIDAAATSIAVARDWTDGSMPSLAGASYRLDEFGPAVIEQLRQGVTLAVNDVAADSRLASCTGYACIGSRSLVIVPLIEANRLSALLYLHRAQPCGWTAEDIALAEDVARQTREAVRRARVEESLRDETRILEVLNRTGQALASTLDLDTLLQAITDAGTQLSGAKFGGFFHNGTDGKGDALVLYKLSGAPREAFDKLGQPRTTPVFRPTFGEHGLVRSDDITADPRYGQMGGHNGMPPGHLPVRSYLAAPVISRSGEVLGGLFFGHPDVGVFTERTERIVAGVAAQAAVAMDNARLYEIAQRSARERDALLQSERAARVAAERLSRTKDEFLAMLAHELRNPLAPISSSASLLSAQFADEPRIRKASGIISRQVKHMVRLIDDLLDVSRVTRGLVELQRQVLDMRDVIASALDQTRPLIDAKRQRLTVRFPPEPVPVNGDQTRLIQTVANVLNNAAKYTQEEGAISVELAMEAGRVTIRVGDNGSGMPAELVPSVFELFTQGARTLARSQGGLGLGLALVKKLIELHGGEVGAHSDGVGRGSEFTIVLPALGADGPAGGVARLHDGHDDGHAHAPAARALRLIVVDDNTDAADSLATLLRAQGYRTVVEYNGEGALRRARSERPDAMLIDIGLPDLDGYQVAEMLRSLPGAEHRVLIAVTGYGQANDRALAKAAGFAHHLVKPIDMTALGRILASIESRGA